MDQYKSQTSFYEMQNWLEFRSLKEKYGKYLKTLEKFPNELNTVFTNFKTKIVEQGLLPLNSQFDDYRQIIIGLVTSETTTILELNGVL